MELFIASSPTGMVFTRPPASTCIYHKTRISKVMVLAGCARPRPKYGFDSKVGIFSFTRERLAKRIEVRTGTVVGETLVLEDVQNSTCFEVAKHQGCYIDNDDGRYALKYTPPTARK